MSETRDRVLAMFDSYTETAEAVFEAIEAGEEYEEQDAEDWLSDWPLSLDRRYIVDVTLAAGGPTAYIRCECYKDDHGQLGIDRATFIAAWGGDSQERYLEPSDALWRVAERFIEGMEA